MVLFCDAKSAPTSAKFGEIGETGVKMTEIGVLVVLK